MPRDARDPEGQYEPQKPWTSEDYIDFVTKRLGYKREKDITEHVQDVIRQRAVIGKVKYGRPLEADTHVDPLEEAIEECADMLFYLVCAREKAKGDR